MQKTMEVCLKPEPRARVDQTAKDDNSWIPRIDGMRQNRKCHTRGSEDAL